MTTDALSSRELLEKLVSFDTTSSRSNLPLIEFVRAYLGRHGVASRLFMSPEKDKANLFATIGPREDGGIALSGHTDCVPVADQDWASDPFTLTERDGRLYGRGSADMKGFIACCLAKVPEIVAAPLSRPVHLAFSYDEELGCEGVESLVKALGESEPMPSAVIVGEPTTMDVVDAHKSISDFVTTITGRAAHSANIHLGANAIIAASELIGELVRMRDAAIAAGDPSGRFDPPYTTVHVGTIRGGTAMNIVPTQCRFSWEIRGLPGADPEAMRAGFERFAESEVLPGLREIAPEAEIVTERMVHVVGLRPEPGSPAERLAMRASGRNDTRTVSFATEGGVFQAQGAPTIVCGPGDIAQAHKPDEFIEISQLHACERFLDRVIETARGR
ncbi:acetylornithine deacetylase [Lutibaculum baratangense]|uniref:Acetylornithine deacetylase n=1 Tax=Lutibaculum baratangense AMV1 TaxID=631454 RepID=V4RQA3_9HYPH|nr:acetylornithine deacetylase [Lutibaculum baratangense]ESR27414.1 Acetylornithine deacetylase [Lutibaculum baratangense AMV1]